MFLHLHLLLSRLFAQSLHATHPQPIFTPLHTVPGTRNLENLAIRHTAGDILVTSVTSSKLHQVSQNTSIAPIVVADIKDTSALLGIVELEQDVFYIAGCNFSAETKTAAAGSNRVWRIDLRNFEQGKILNPATNVSLVATFPDAKILNGMTKLTDQHILISDSGAGTIIRLDVQTGRHSIVIQDPTFTPLDSGGIGVGVNGIHTHGGYLYYTSLDQNIFARIPINSKTGIPRGEVEILAKEILFQDDFALSKDGKRAWIANNGENTVTEVDIERKTYRVLANSTNLQAASSVALGKDCDGEVMMFVTGSRNVSVNETVGMVSEGRLLL